jgi:hypothetical protein
MTNESTNGTIINGAAHASSANPSAPPFDTAAITTMWMSSAARLMRANEIFMRGMSDVARMEAELGQHILQRGMGVLQTSKLGARPEQVMRTQMDQTMLTVDHLITSMRQIADEFRHTVGESTQALFDVSHAAQVPSAAASVHADSALVKSTSGATTPGRSAAA